MMRTNAMPCRQAPLDPAGQAGRPKAQLATPVLISLLSTIWGCSPSPAEQLYFGGTSWTVTSIGDLPIPPGEMTLSFSDHDQSITIHTGCRTIVIGVSWDNSGSWISFEAPPPLASECGADLAARDKALAGAIEGAVDWEHRQRRGDRPAWLERCSADQTGRSLVRTLGGVR
jgi:hypothetical protein